MRPLSILFTNSTLAGRAGSEVWVRDVARVLVARRHQPIAFSLVLGPVAQELRAATVPVVDDPAQIAAVPDVIHGHHHLETLIAALHFPAVPIVHFCHGWLPWEERPLKHPSIVRYVAVDETCAQRLTMEEGIPPERVELLLNYVDLERFQPRDPLPRRPKRALVFSNHATEDGFVAVVREAARRAGIDLRVAGNASGHVLEQPERDLRDYDLVFAKGRAALEALAVGCSVVVADVAGAGPLVRADDLGYLRSRNLGIRLLQHPHTVDWYVKQIAAYDPDEAREVQTRVRASAGLDAAVDRLLEIYQAAIGEGTPSPAIDGRAIMAQRAAAAHLCSVLPTLKAAHAQASQNALRDSELATANEWHARLRAERDRLELRAAAAERSLSELTQKCSDLQQSVEAYQQLTIVRLRNALLRTPVLGRAAHPVARALGRLFAS
jgi:glycosyltransferase involved in cell wall biosynthesis